MMTKTLLASAVVLAFSGAAHAASNTNDGSPNSHDGSKSMSASPSTGSPGTPVMNTNDGTPTTKDGAKANFSERSVGTDGKPTMTTNDGTPTTDDGRNAAMKRDYGKSTEYGKYRSTKAPYAARASDVVGADVVNANHKEIGEVDDVIVSRKDNQMHAVIEVGGFLGIGEKLVSVPLDELRMDGHGNVYLNASEKELKERPTFAYYDNEPMGMERWNMRPRNKGSLN